MATGPGRQAVIGIDVGGTFTDVVVVRGTDILLEKVLTTPDDPSEGILAGCQRALERMEIAPEEVDLISHATTIVTNALIERKGSKTALIVTRGFRDVLEIGNEQRYHIYDLALDKPKPLVPRSLGWEVGERILADGSIFQELDRDEIVTVLEAMAARGVESVAVCLLHAYANPMHEQEIAAIAAERFPALVISLSSQVAPEIREWERMSTTVANAYVRPVCGRYLENLSQKLAAAGVRCDFHVMVSSGGIASWEIGRDLPVRLMESGPAAGVMAASYYGRLKNIGHLLAFDMGGTTAKICLIVDSTPRRAREFETARVSRFQKGSGLPIKVPVIELIEIGAGGGSIAHIDEVGLLKVGPQSAGARPGPACYGQGGTEPTVTDADLLLGYLSPDYFLGGEMSLDVAAARGAMEGLADRLGMSVDDAARGVHQVVNENMAIATRVHAAEQGEDPRKYVLMAFGGAGPVHSYEVARNLKLKQIVCPAGAGTLSALGLLVAPRAVEFVQSYPTPLQELDWARLRRILTEMRDRARETLLLTGVSEEAIRYRLSVDMRYRGQGFEVETPVDPAILNTGEIAGLVRGFEETYTRLFGRIVPNSPIEALTWRVQAEAPPRVTEVGSLTAGRGGAAAKGRRRVFFPEAGRFVETSVLDRYALRPGDEYVGPCVVEERESTVVVGPSGRIMVDEYFNLIVTIDEAL